MAKTSRVITFGTQMDEKTAIDVDALRIENLNLKLQIISTEYKATLKQRDDLVKAKAENTTANLKKPKKGG